MAVQRKFVFVPLLIISNVFVIVSLQGALGGIINSGSSEIQNKKSEDIQQLSSGSDGLIELPEESHIHLSTTGLLVTKDGIISNATDEITGNSTNVTSHRHGKCFYAMFGLRPPGYDYPPPPPPYGPYGYDYYRRSGQNTDKKSIG